MLLRSGRIERVVCVRMTDDVPLFVTRRYSFTMMVLVKIFRWVLRSRIIEALLPLDDLLR